MKIVSKIVVATMVAAMAAPVYSFGLSDLKVKTSKTSTSSVDSYSAQDGLVVQYSKAALNIAVAQQMFAEALGLKQDAAGLQESIDALQAGSVTDKDSIERITDRSDAVDEQINTKIEEGEELSEEAKAKYATAFIPYLTGLIETKKIAPEAEGFLAGAQQTISASSLMEKMKVTKKLSSGMYVAKEIPGLIQGLYKTSGALFSFAKKQGITVPKDATDIAGGINFDD